MLAGATLDSPGTFLNIYNFLATSELLFSTREVELPMRNPTRRLSGRIQNSKSR
jgi:hypothetical protein